VPHTTLYYWHGGAEAGQWREITCASGSDLTEKRESTERMGYLCILGDKRIGPPEGPPPVEVFRAFWERITRGKV